MVKPLTPQQMVEVRAFAPFEIVEVMKEWHARWDQTRKDACLSTLSDAEAAIILLTGMDGLGAPYRCAFETAEEFGQRVATAIFTLIKEI